MTTSEQVAALVDAVWQTLDDMGAGDATSCCLHSKAQLRAAFEPFHDPDCPVDMSLADSVAIIRSVEHG